MAAPALAATAAAPQPRASGIFKCPGGVVVLVVVTAGDGEGRGGPTVGISRRQSLGQH